MNSYAVAFGILGLGVFLAVLLWSLPRLRQRRQVRRFRKQLAHVDLLTVAWSHSLRESEPSDDVPTPLPETRRTRRGRRNEPDAGGDALV